jgi:hypothetical protein
MRLSLLRATFLAPVFSSKTLTADAETVLELDEARGLVFVTRRGVERFTPISNLVEAEAVMRIAETKAHEGTIGPGGTVELAERTVPAHEARVTITPEQHEARKARLLERSGTVYATSTGSQPEESPTGEIAGGMLQPSPDSDTTKTLTGSFADPLPRPRRARTRRSDSGPATS